MQNDTPKLYAVIDELKLIAGAEASEQDRLREEVSRLRDSVAHYRKEADTWHEAYLLEREHVAKLTAALDRANAAKQ